MWNRYANTEIARQKYGVNRSKTLADLVSSGPDVETIGTVAKDFDVYDIQEDVDTKVTRPKKTGKNVYVSRDDYTDIFY